MVEYFKNLQGAELRQRAKFDEFVLGEDGGVEGVIIRENYKFDSNSLKDDVENTSGEKKTIKAKKGVVLAAGGFCRDVFFRKVIAKYGKVKLIKSCFIL